MIFLHDNAILDCRARDEDGSVAINRWDAHYLNRACSYSATDDWVTVSTWTKHLFGMLPFNLAGRVIVDIGCGTADRIKMIIPPAQHGYRYVGVDSSRDALERAARNMPGSLLIRSDLGSLKLRESIADVILCLGVLMYFEDPSSVVEKVLRLLKPGGFLLLHEAIPRRALSPVLRRISPSKQGRRFPDAHGVCRHKLRAQLQQYGAVIHWHLAGSPLRRPLCRLVDPRWTKFLRPVALGVDSFWSETAGLIARPVGAAEFQFVFQKATAKSR